MMSTNEVTRKKSTSVRLTGNLLEQIKEVASKKDWSINKTMNFLMRRGLECESTQRKAG